MAHVTVGGVLLEGQAPTFDASAFNSQPMFPSAVWTSSGGAQYTWTDVWITNHICMAVIGAAIVIAFWLIVSHKMTIVPSKRQWFGEYVYNIIRNGVGREMIGEGYKRFVPWLLGLFCFILVNNWFGEFFPFMFPTFSKIGFAWGLAILTWLLYNYVGIRRHGFGHYMKKMTIPDGVPKPLLILIAPLEFISNFLTRPITLGIRLFANLFAGHLMVLIFVVGGTYLLTWVNNVAYNIAGGASLLMSFFIFALELLVGFLQAYVFTVLTAQYVSSALSEGH
ncbi:MAG: F0F1 ATP synthase subunit A [Propionibacteriaceae bacterium]|jgi:F-type H+-transporting ATPase subunit a|nr:F0F1 ATP synthase subunit A [Propionibacteriaceae bacterium]